MWLQVNMHISWKRVISKKILLEVVASEQRQHEFKESAIIWQWMEWKRRRYTTASDSSDSGGKGSFFLPSTWEHSMLTAAAAPIDAKLSLAGCWWCDRDRCAHSPKGSCFFLYGVAIFSHSLSPALFTHQDLQRNTDFVHDHICCLAPSPFILLFIAVELSSRRAKKEIIMNVVGLHP